MLTTKQAAWRDVLHGLSRRITYGEFATLIGRSHGHGRWKLDLDAIAADDLASGLPDSTLMLFNKATGRPGQIDGQRQR